MFNYRISYWWALAHNDASGYLRSIYMVMGTGLAGVIRVGGGDVYLFRIRWPV